MALIQKLAALIGYEKRDASCVIDPSWAALSYGFYAPGLSPLGAENLACVLACVNAIGTALGSVPALVYRREGENRIEQPRHPLAQLVRYGPMDDMTWPEFVEELLASTLLTGNGLAIIRRNARGIVESLDYVPWSYVSVQFLPTGRIAYDIFYPLTGKGERVLHDQVIHLRDRRWGDNKIGRSRLSRAAETVNAAHEANRFAAHFMRNSAQPSGILSAPGAISKETADRLKTTWQTNHAGPSNSGKIAVAGDGLKFESVQISPEDAQLLESRAFSVIEIARIFQVPPPIIQAYEHNTFTNAAQSGVWFAMYTLSPWAKKIEAEFARNVFPYGSQYEFELSLDGFLRGDPQTRWQTYDIAAKNNILAVDEIRQIEGYGPKPNDGTPPADLAPPAAAA